MRYQIAIFHRDSESWSLHRVDFALVSFGSLEEAEAEAIRLSEMYSGQQILAITIHSGFTTETEYPKPEPIRKTTRVTVS